MNQQTATGNQQVNTGFKAELAEILDTLKEMGDARNFSQTSTSSGGIDKVANRTADMDSMFKELRRNLPATYFRNNSRIKRIFDQILTAHQTNQEEIFEVRQSGGPTGGIASPTSFLEKLERCKRHLSDLINRL
jgi:hypothetical protein